MTPASRTTPFNLRPPKAAAHQDHFTLAMHQEAENALSMALHYLRSGGSNVPGATRKAVQALGALNRLEMLGLNSGAHTTGRA